MHFENEFPDVVFLSPHRDDAAFSCGMLLLDLLAKGASVAIVNVNTISAYAPYLEPDDTDRTTQVTKVRAAEDVLFAGRLLSLSGCPPDRLQMIDLGWEDVPLRWRMPAEQSTDALPVRSAEVLALAGEFRTIPAGALVIAPCALGEHLDHRLVREAAVSSRHANSLLLYEDLPYGCRLPAAELSLNKEAPQDSPLLAPGIRRPGLKWELASCYPSQIATDVADEMERYAQQLGGCERFFGNAQAQQWLLALLSQRSQIAGTSL